MIKIYKQWLCLITTVLVLGSCKKDDQNIFNMFKDVTVDYHATNKYSVTDYKQVNEGDTVQINFTINSPNKDLYSIYLTVAGVTSFSAFKRIDITADSLRHSYTGVFQFIAGSTVSGNITKAGPTTFRVCGVDKGGVYVGDGYKTVTVDVMPGYTYYNDRLIFTPDSIEKNTNMFFSISNKASYNFSEASQRSGEIDFGLYARVGQLSATDTTLIRRIYLFSPSATPKNKIFNTDSWAQSGTLFSEPVTTAANFTGVTTAAKLRADATASNRAYKAAPSGFFTGLGSVYYFKTAQGKYGVLYFTELYSRKRDKGIFERYEELTVNVKMER